ncbi:MAG: hypothetical protein V7K27_15750 [Nostoc sp.]|uniref:hypothetical protein n=1 Tax=Nostoc sp. TaxID=1180 RepID=UPI002FF9E79C
MDKRIIVIGSAPHSRSVTAYNWHEIPLSLNIADYDIVILNFVPLMEQNYAAKIDFNLLPQIEKFAEFIFSSESEVIAIGAPYIKIGFPPNYVLVDWWLPIKLNLVQDVGETIRNVDPAFDYYFQQIEQWFFHVDDRFRIQFELTYYLQLISSHANDLQVKITPIAQTRYDKSIAFKVNLIALFIDKRYDFGNPPYEKIVKESGDIIWLPQTTKISDYDAINLILSNRYGLNLEQTSPLWIESYKLPKQIPIDAKILHYKNEIQRLKSELTIAQQDLQVEIRFRKLLYEQGVDGLEPIVRDALRELGATVHDPLVGENREDGLLEDPKGRKGILEIKGRTKSLALADVRQLDQWVQDALFKDNSEDRKGILIANMYCGVSLEQRKEPFPANCIERAKRTKHCLLTTRQIYYAICLKQQGKFLVTDFWDSIFNTDGACSLPEIEPILPNCIE